MLKSTLQTYAGFHAPTQLEKCNEKRCNEEVAMKKKIRRRKMQRTEVKCAMQSALMSTGRHFHDSGVDDIDALSISFGIRLNQHMCLHFYTQI